MGKSSTILLLLAISFISLSQEYEDYMHNGDSDFLDYIASKKQEIEDALLQDRSTRDLYRERDLKYFDPEHREYHDDDLPDNYSFHNEEEDDDDGDEGRDEEEDRQHLRNIEREKKRRIEKIKQLKKESNNVNSPNHFIDNAEIYNADSVLKKNSKIKKNPKSKQKSTKIKDLIQSRRNEALSKQELHGSKNEPDDTQKDKKKSKKDSNRQHLQNLQNNYEKKDSDTKLSAKEHSMIDDTKLSAKEQSMTDDTKFSAKEHSMIADTKLSAKEQSMTDNAKFSAKEQSMTGDTKLSAKEQSVTADAKSDNTNVANKNGSSNKSTPSHSPVVLPSPKAVSSKKNLKKLDKALFIMVVAACSVAGIAGLVLASYCWYRLRKQTDDSSEDEYKKKSEKVKEKKSETDDDKLAKGAEVYHYMHAKKQLAAMEKAGTKKKAAIAESDSSDEESDNTVYECPGLAPPGDMKVINPLFSDAEKEHSDVKSDDSHVSSPTREFSPPQTRDQSDPSHK